MNNLLDLLRRDEGLRLTAYDDADGRVIVPGKSVKGHPTIGYGRALDVEGITQDEAAYLLANDVSHVKIELAEAMPWVTGLSEPRQAVLQSLCYNMGLAGLETFKLMLAAVEAGNYDIAASEMLRSKWMAQVGDRAIRLANQMRSGSWV